MEAEKKLNLILKHFLTVDSRTIAQTNLQIKFAKNEFRDDAEVVQAIHKLEKDDYIVYTESIPIANNPMKDKESFYLLTYNGEMFISGWFGGYVWEKRKENITTIFQVLNSFAILCAAIFACLYYLGYLRPTSESHKPPQQHQSDKQKLQQCR